MFKKIIFICVLLCFSNSVFGITRSDENSVLDFQTVSIQSALHILAKMMHANVILSPHIHGNISLHLHQMSAKNAFKLLLLSYDLAQWRTGNTLFIVPRTELIQRQQEEIKLHEVQNEAAPLINRVWQIHYARADELAHLLQDGGTSLLSKRGHVRVDLRTNTLCVQDTEETVQSIQHLLHNLDVPVQQILIQARLASIDSDFEHELGINFELQHEGAVSPGRFGLALVRLPDCSLLDIQLSALEKNGHGELISSPCLFTANQQAASIESGEEIPYQEVSRSGGTSVAFKKAVLSLKVIPQIMPGHDVLLQLKVNQDKPSNHLVLGVPSIDTRQIETQVLIKDGQTIVLGGIYETDQENNQQRIPFLGKIPLVGLLFQQQTCAVKKRELLIFVTPTIVPLRA